MLQYLSDILAIVEGGARGDAGRVELYAEDLAKKLSADGDRPAAERIRRALQGARRSASSSPPVTASSVQTSTARPTDSDSQLPLADIEELPRGSVTFFGDHGVRAKADEFVQSMQALRRLTEAGMSVAPTLLTYGPPGCGKTQLARWVSSELALPLVTCRVDALVSSYLGTTARNIRQLFDFAASSPCVLFLDELDAVAKLRDDRNELGELKRVVVGLLQNLDSLPKHCVVLAATNHEHLLDPAVWRRFEWRIKMGPPDDSVRQHLLHWCLGEAVEAQTCMTFTALTGQMSGADVCRIAQTARRRAFVAGESGVPHTYLYRAVLEERGVAILADNDAHFRASVRQVRDFAPQVFTVRRLAQVFGVTASRVQRALEKKR